MSEQKSRSTQPLRTRWQGLTFQLFAIVVFPLTVLILFISFGSVYLHQSAMRDLVEERDKRAVSAAANAVSEQLNHRAAAIRGLALRTTEGDNLAGALESSDFLLKDFDFGLAIISPEGKLLASQGKQDFWKDLSVDFLTELGESNQSSFGEPGFSAPLLLSDFLSPIVFSVSEIKGEGNFVVGAFSLWELASRSLKEPFPTNNSLAAFLVAQDFQILYQQGNSVSPDRLVSHPGVLKALNGESGTVYYNDGEEDFVVAYSVISPTAWALVIEDSWRSAASPLLRFTEVGPLFLVPVVLLSLVAFWFGVRQVIQPLQALKDHSAALAWGDYEAINEEVGGIEEIGSLQRSLIHMAHKFRTSQQGLRGYIGAITKGQEEERQRLARELHDDTIQSLIVLNQKAQLAQMPSSQEAKEASLVEIQGLIEDSIKNLRRLTRDLRPLYLEDLGLAAGLDMLVQDTSKMVGISINFSREGPEQRLLPEIEMALYRIAQEGLNNVMRHAHAKHATIRLTFSDEDVTLTISISDDGKGFIVPESPADFAERGHYGLLGIYERVELIKAKLNIQGGPGQGTNMIVSVFF